jgi:hypothetical protein
MRETKAANPVFLPPSISRSTPSRTAFPKGLVVLEPPRKRSQIRSANVSACASELNSVDADASPKLRVTILPLD